MLGEAVKLALDGNLRTVAYVERESYAAAALVARMEDKALDQAPVCDLVEQCSADEALEYLRRFNPLVISGGFPCQPFSQAGKRLATDDDRHLWPEYAALIKRSKPAAVFFENVPGIITARTIHHRRDLCGWIKELDRAAQAAPTPKERWYLQRHRERLYGRFLQEYGIPVLLFILCELEQLGFRATAGIWSAEEVGASHQRDRVFILGLADAEGKDWWSEQQEERKEGRRSRSTRSDRSVANAGGVDGRQGWTESAGLIGGGATDEPSGNVGNAIECGHDRRTRTARRGSVGGAAAQGTGEELADAIWISGGEWAERERVCEGGDGKLADAGEQGFQGANGSETSGSTAEFRIPLFSPGPGDADTWKEILEIDPALEPAICRVADGLAAGSHADRLRLTGNGVVPLAAAYAFVSLAAVLIHTGPRELYKPEKPRLTLVRRRVLR